MAVDVLLGLQWGDEGKGKVVDFFTTNYDIIARFQGGPNAGHTLEFDGYKHVLHTIPSGVFRKEAMNLIGNGVVIDPVIFKKEIEKLLPRVPEVGKRLLISRKAHLILPTHRLLDAASEAAKGKAKIGSTLRGIGPTYMDKTGRNGLRVGDIELPDFKDRYEALKQKHLALLEGFEFPFDLAEAEAAWMDGVAFIKAMQLCDSDFYVHQSIHEGKRILAEGAQGSLLDIDFGTYPFVTSSNTTSAGACTGLGIAPNRIQEVFGIFKAYCTRVGSGPFPTELDNALGEELRQQGREFGATTGRPRRTGWLDLLALKYAIEINGVTQLMMMKSDVLNGMDEIEVCVAYEYLGKEIQHLPYRVDDGLVKPIYKKMKGWKTMPEHMNSRSDMPAELQDYIAFIEEFTGVPVTLVSYGPDRTQTLHLPR